MKKKEIKKGESWRQGYQAGCRETEERMIQELVRAVRVEIEGLLSERNEKDSQSEGGETCNLRALHDTVCKNQRV